VPVLSAAKLIIFHRIKQQYCVAIYSYKKKCYQAKRRKRGKNLI
jgi:hypothetical protein